MIYFETLRSIVIKHGGNVWKPYCPNNQYHWVLKELEKQGYLELGPIIATAGSARFTKRARKLLQL